MMVPPTPPIPPAPWFPLPGRACARPSSVPAAPVLAPPEGTLWLVPGAGFVVGRFGQPESPRPTRPIKATASIRFIYLLLAINQDQKIGAQSAILPQAAMVKMPALGFRRKWRPRGLAHVTLV